MESVKNAISEALDLKFSRENAPKPPKKFATLVLVFKTPPPHPQLEICSAVPEYTVKLKKKMKKTN